MASRSGRRVPCRAAACRCFGRCGSLAAGGRRQAASQRCTTNRMGVGVRVCGVRVCGWGGGTQLHRPRSLASFSTPSQSSENRPDDGTGSTTIAGLLVLGSNGRAPLWAGSDIRHSPPPTCQNDPPPDMSKCSGGRPDGCPEAAASARLLRSSSFILIRLFRAGHLPRRRHRGSACRGSEHRKRLCFLHILLIVLATACYTCYSLIKVSNPIQISEKYYFLTVRPG